MSKQDAPPSDLFVSYAQADRDWVVGYLLDALIAAGVRARSTANFAVGAPRLAEFETALKQCSRILLVLSPAYLADAGLQFVDLIAQQYGLESGAWPVIPFVALPYAIAAAPGLPGCARRHRPGVVARCGRTRVRGSAQRAADASGQTNLSLSWYARLPAGRGALFSRSRSRD